MLTITDANACTVIHSVPVHEPTPVVLQTQLQEITCPGMKDGALNAFASGGTGPYTYLWNDGQTSAEIQALDAGNYTVLATDAHGCTVSTTETLLEPDLHEVDLGR